MSPVKTERKFFMSSMNHQQPARTQAHADEEYEMPCAEAVLAGTLALMTGHVQAGCEGSRALMARNVVSNLAILTEHPQLSEPFRAMLGKLRCRWVAQVKPVQQAHPSDEATAAVGTDAAQEISDAFKLDQLRVLWHKTPGIAQ
jgi:hypothetical protein